MSREHEIERLASLLEGGRPIQAVNSDCCYRDTEARINVMQDEINVLKKEKCNLEICWKGNIPVFVYFGSWEIDSVGNFKINGQEI